MHAMIDCCARPEKVDGEWGGGGGGGGGGLRFLLSPPRWKETKGSKLKKLLQIKEITKT